MVIYIVLGLAVVLLVGLINAEKTEKPKWILLFKTPLSLLFIVAWTLQPDHNTAFSGLIIIALWFCLGGDILFYISDLFVARQRFVVDSPVNRVVGLPLYYVAQFLLAFSAAWVPG